MSNGQFPTYFISHGGGPWPWLKEEMPIFAVLERFLREIPSQLKEKPKAILVISGHWEESEVTLMTSPKPPMLYDYYGFPEHTYHIQYPAFGEPNVALEAQRLLAQAGFTTRLDAQRGFDHGTFVPMFAMYPDADVPIFQVSMKAGYDPEAHFKMGQALAPLRKEGVLIVGSGLSYHNLRTMLNNTEVGRLPSKQFDDWLQGTLLHSKPEERHSRLLKWAQAPSARMAHPREDHLIPLMVVVGAGETEKAELVHHELFMGAITTSSFKFG